MTIAHILRPGAEAGSRREYHLRELEIALDPGDARHLLPPPLPARLRVLDIGCGAGQTLIAAYPDRISFGLDVDFEALALGRSLTGRVCFVQGRAEALPYRDRQFDRVIARVSLPYMNIPAALKEVHRVLKRGGDLWVTLHPASMPWKKARTGGLRNKLFFAYILINSMAFHLAGREFSCLGRCESFQTVRGMTRALEHSGFTAISIPAGPNFLATASAA